MAEGPATLKQNNLPAPLTRFIGREAEIAEVRGLLAGESRPGNGARFINPKFRLRKPAKLRRVLNPCAAAWPAMLLMPTTPTNSGVALLWPPKRLAMSPPSAWEPEPGDLEGEDRAEEEGRQSQVGNGPACKCQQSGGDRDRWLVGGGRQVRQDDESAQGDGTPGEERVPMTEGKQLRANPDGEFRDLQPRARAVRK